MDLPFSCVGKSKNVTMRGYTTFFIEIEQLTTTTTTTHNV